MRAALREIKHRNNVPPLHSKEANTKGKNEKENVAPGFEFVARFARIFLSFLCATFRVHASRLGLKLSLRSRLPPFSLKKRFPGSKSSFWTIFGCFRPTGTVFEFPLFGPYSTHFWPFWCPSSPSWPVAAVGWKIENLEQHRSE